MPALLGLLQLLTIGAIGFWLISVLYTAWALLHPPRRTYAWALHRGVPGDPSELDTPLKFREHRFESQSRSLNSWIIQGMNPAGPRLVLVHGWGSSSIGALKRIPHLAEHASQIITLDLPGHGESAGNAQMGTNEHIDLDALLSSIDQLTGPVPTIVYGWSMGAGIALRFTKDFHQQHNIQAVIAESPYIHAQTPARNVINLRGLPTKLNLKPAIMLIGLMRGVGFKWTGFARDTIATEVTQPILLIHGTNDPVCPLADSQQIQSAAPNATLIKIKEGGHNNLWTVQEFTQLAATEIQNFFASC